MDNTAIERIATPDLSSDALALLEKYGANDDVVFFLGRLVWQGKMSECVPALVEIALDPVRGRYGRIAAIRGVMAVGEAGFKDRVWETIAAQPGPLDRSILAELLDWASPTTRSVALLLQTLEHVAPCERFSPSGLEGALHRFIDTLPVMADDADAHPLGELIDGLNNFLDRTPFIERGECHVSEEFAWLMSPALHAVDRLVAARSAQALSPAPIAVLRNMPALRFWRGNDFAEHKSSLGKNVPRWQELNDLLYWSSIAECRSKLEKKGQPLVDDWQVAFVGPFWGFGPGDFERCLDWVGTRDGDDRFVALSRCIHLYIEADRPAAWLARLRHAVKDSDKLKLMLEARLNPTPSPELVKMDAEHERWKREREEAEKKEEKNRADWVRELKANPDQVLHPAGLKPGALSNDQYFLLRSTMSDRISTSREDGANWHALVPEFGEAVARAYRDSAVAHWRAYWPGLRSEGAETGSTPYSLLFAMTGLAIEAGEDSAFAQRLMPDEARLAFRYITWELNGFPSWFEPLYRVHSVLGLEAVSAELLWELDHSATEQPLHHILHDLLYHAPWLHADVAPLILDWLGSHETLNADALRYCLNILAEGKVASGALAALARKKVEGACPMEQRPRWFALWVDVAPDAAIPELESTLTALPPEDAAAFAQQFVVGLLGDRHGTGTRVGAYRNAHDLKSLYILMHRFIRAAEDIDRANKGAYSPTLRDNAQDARNTLFNMLVTVPGPEAYAAIKALGDEHPEPNYRRWMAIRAHERATADGDEPTWTAEQVRAFTDDIAGARAA